MNAGDFRYVVMDFAIGLPEDILGTFLIVPSLRVEGLELTYNTNPEFGEKIKFELFNKDRNRKIVIKKRRETCFVYDNKRGIGELPDKI